MFGYIRPRRDTLLVRDYDRYRAAYCGLCRALGKRCGFAAPPMILGMVLSDICENNWRRAVILANAKGGMLSYFLSRPISIVLALLIVVSLFSPMIMSYVDKKSKENVTK